MRAEPYKQVNDWAQHVARLGADQQCLCRWQGQCLGHGPLRPKGCAGSDGKPIWELSADGKEMKNFRRRNVSPSAHVKPDAQGNIWAIDGDAKDGKGESGCSNSRPTGKVMMTLGKAGQGGAGPDVFDRPTGNRVRAERRHLRLRRPRADLR